MEVYTITLQFRVEAESEYAAKSKAETLRYNLPVKGVLDVLSCDVHYYETIPEDNVSTKKGVA